MITPIASSTRRACAIDEHGSRFVTRLSGLLPLLGLVALVLGSAPVLAQTAPPLGLTATYGIVSDTFTNSNTAPQTIINGDVCYTTAPVTPPLTITGATVVPCPPQVGLDQGIALADLNGQPCTFLGAGAITLDSIVIGVNPPGTIPPGCYFSGGAMNITATTIVTLQGAGIYIFRPGGALNTGADSQVVMAAGACSDNVYWAPVAAATIGANAALSPTPTFVGTIIADAGISMGNFAHLAGRLLSNGGTVTTDAVTVSPPSCIAGPSVGGSIPTLSEWVMILLAGMLAMAGLMGMRLRQQS